MKNLMLTLIGSLITFSVFTQSNEVIFYESETVEKGSVDGYLEAVDENGDSYIYYDAGRMQDKLLKLSPDMKTTKSVVAKEYKRQKTFSKYFDIYHGIVLMKNKGFLIYYRGETRTMHYHAPKEFYFKLFDKESLDFEKEKVIATSEKVEVPKGEKVPQSFYMGMKRWGVEVSPDKTKMLFWKKEVHNEKAPTYEFIVFDENLNLLWKRKVDIKSNSDEFYMHDIYFTNDERILFTGNDYDMDNKSLNKEWKTPLAGRGFTFVPKFSNSISIITVSKEESKIQKADFENVVPIKSTILSNNKNNQLWIGGIYLMNNYVERGSYMINYEWSGLDLKQKHFKQEQIEDKVLNPFKTGKRQSINLMLFECELAFVDNEKIVMTSRGYSADPKPFKVTEQYIPSFGIRFIEDFVVSTFTKECDYIYTTAVPHKAWLKSAFDELPKFHTIITKNGKVSIITFEDSGNINVDGFEKKRNPLDFFEASEEMEWRLSTTSNPNYEFNIVRYDLGVDGKIENTTLLINHKEIAKICNIPLYRTDYMINVKNNIRFVIERGGMFYIGKIKL